MNDDALRDAQLVEAALAGDSAAFGQLVTRYQDRLFNSLVRMLGSHEDAADAVQDAFVQAYQKLESFRGASQFYTWLYQIAKNAAFSRQRRRRPSGPIIGDPIGPVGQPEDELQKREQIERVQAALAELGDEHRQIMVLREIDGLAYEEIAEILELPVGTVRSRLFRARAQLKEILAAYWGEQAETVKP